MTRIRVDEANKIGYIQAGARIHDIEVETMKYGLGAVVGVCSQVSIGGYYLGGGIGYKTGSYGLAADNLVSATVVLASGETVKANESENPDLFWALRGGYVYLPAQLPQVVEAINAWREEQKDHDAIQFLITMGPDGNPYVIINGISNATKEDGEAAYNRFLELGPVNVTNSQIPYTEVSNLANAFNDLPGNKMVVGAHVDVFDLPQVQRSLDAWHEIVKKAPLSALMYEFYPYKSIAKVPIQQAAFAQRHEFMTVLCGVIWTDESFTFHARDELLRLKSVVSGSSSKEAQESLGYVNYADPFSTLNATDEYARKIFGPNYPRLQEIKKKYDPNLVFNRPSALELSSMSSLFTAFKESVKGTVCQPGEEGYNLSKWAPNGTKPSKIIVTPEETEDIAKAIKYARSEGLAIAIRGGGHSTSTASATDDLLIDMRKMTRIRVDEANKIGYIQAGARAHDIEVETMKYGASVREKKLYRHTLAHGVLPRCRRMSVRLGRSHRNCEFTELNLRRDFAPLKSELTLQCSQVSIGGYTLGGGIGYSTGSHGLAADNLVSATVVLASGEIVKANESENPDLFWALRGGYVYLPAQLPQVVETINAWRKEQKAHETIHFLITLGPDGNNTFNELPGNKMVVGAHVDVFDLPQVQKSWDAWNEIVKKAPFSAFMYEFYPYKPIAKVPIEQAAFGQRHEFVTVLCGVVWTDESFTPHARDELLRLKSVVSGSSSKEAQESLGYVNYADPFSTLNETDEYARKIFGPNYPRLQEIKKKYDPNLVFNRWFAIQPAN
ncbi:hypothetical protein FRC01_003743 [Tulasnella sp. 417]|nr:hypothetical protein FRC01_003743 [Tulasnella sp. 417]